MPWLFTNLITEILLPPMSLLLLGGVGLALLNPRPVFGKVLIVLMLVLFYGVSAPYVSEIALRSLELPAPLGSLSKNHPGAIVVLGGGTYFKAPEYATDTVDSIALERLRYAARLYRQAGIPILVAGGKPQGNALSEAHQMRSALLEDFRVPAKWLEAASDNTYENARNSREILKEAGVDTVFLVTHAWHMPRARLAFEHAGFTVVPAPTGFTTPAGPAALSFIPSARGLLAGRRFLHETLGILWYRLRFQIDAWRAQRKETG